MFTIDYFTHVGATPAESRIVDCELLDDAVAEAEAKLANQAAELGQGERIMGYVITDGLNAIVYNTFEPAGAAQGGPPAP